MKLLTTLTLIALAGPLCADTATPSVSVSPAQADRYGCAVRQRPDELTYSGFRDAWRNIAANDLYSLRRHQAALDAGSCACDALWPDWSGIKEEFEALDFADPLATDSVHVTWAAAEYFPVISNLRAALREQCQETD
ncbi:hypothetical protein [Psychromarinibacter halotolerans]|uniref:Uncharacterized protein n=1 Tax=Psychromarinibacter halotolerans TaxID=1775175 RepID=A0ABV7GTJ4_9RHOB|nr:hypothetical protein [Psychromarinibacter halotolerans]MDF0597744.1 hypothetical protein [Psychromarinibacter halotolerans]